MLVFLFCCLLVFDMRLAVCLHTSLFHRNDGCVYRRLFISGCVSVSLAMVGGACVLASLRYLIAKGGVCLFYKFAIAID